MIVLLNTKVVETTKIENNSEIPPEVAPEGILTIKGVGLTRDITLTYDTVADMINNGTLTWYNENVTLNAMQYKCEGIDPLELLQEVGIWYAGNLTFETDTESISLETQQLLYGHMPRGTEDDPENLKILLCLALDGKWLYDGTDWMEHEPARLVCPSNEVWEYTENAFVGSVETIRVNSNYSIPIALDGNMIGHIDVYNATDTSLFNYTTYGIGSGDQLLNYGGPTIKSIAEKFGINTTNIKGVNITAIDFVVPQYISWSKFLGPKEALLAMEFEGGPLGYEKGPFRLVGGYLEKYEFSKNVIAIEFVMNEDTTTNTAANLPTGFNIFSISFIFSLAIVSVHIVRRFKHGKKGIMKK